MAMMSFQEKRNDLFVAKIVRHDILKLYSMVITSRHSASMSLHGDIDCRIEILGFTKEKRDEYICQCLKGNTEKVKRVREYLMANPFIDGLCYIPLNMAILICLALESDAENLPKNQTEINDQFTFATISRYLKKQHNLEDCGKNYKDLPTQFKQHFNILCKLAYVFLGKDKIVFNDDDIKSNCPKLLGKWNSLGLLKVVKYHGFLKCTPLASYNFLHFSIQEFLAAYHIHTLNCKKEIKSLRENFWNPRYLNASVMYVGLTKGNSFALRHFLSGHIFRFVTKWSKSTHISTSTVSNKVKCLHLLQCFSEAGNDELIKQLGSLSDDTTIDLSDTVLLPKDMQTLSFFLTRSTTKTWKILNLSQCYMGDNTFDVFCKTFSSFNETNVAISAVNLSYNHFTCASLKGIVDLICCFDVKLLHIDGNSIDKQEFDDVLFAISSEGKISLVLQVGDSDHYFINNYEFDCKKLPHFQPNEQRHFHFWYAHCPAEKFLVCADKSVSVHEMDVDIPQNLMKANNAEYFLQSNLFVNLSSLSERSYIQTSICVISADDDSEVAMKLLNDLQQCNATNCSCVVISKSKVMAYAATNQQMHMIFNNRMNIDTMVLFNCSLTKSAYFKTAPDYWDTIDFSHSNIFDEGVKNLSNFFSCHVKKVHIRYLNLSNNSLNSSSLINLLKHCVVENLVLSQVNNIMDETQIMYNFHVDLCNHSTTYSFQNIPLIVTAKTHHFIYLPKSNFDFNSIRNIFMFKFWQHITLFYVVECLYISGIHIEACMSLDYIDSVLKLHTVKFDTIDEVGKEVISILLDGLTLSHQNIATIDLHDCITNDGNCSTLFELLFNEKSLIKHVDVLGLSFNITYKPYIDLIIASFHYCIIENMIISHTDVNAFTEQLVSSYKSQNKPFNFIQGVPLSLLSFQEHDVIGSQTWTCHIDTFFINYFSELNIKKILSTLPNDLLSAAQHTFHIYDSFSKANKLLQKLLVVMLQKQSINIVICEINLPDKMITEIVNTLTWLGHRIQYVLTSRTMIFAHNFSGHQILEAIRSTLCGVSEQNVIDEHPVYMNTCFIMSSGYFSYYWRSVYLTSCHITDKDLAKLQVYFTRAVIKVLKLSCNGLSLTAVVKFILNCCNVQTVHFIGHYEEFHLCEILSSLLPSSFSVESQIEITFKCSTAFVLCGSHSHVKDFLATAIISTKPVHFMILNCKLLDYYLLQTFSTINNLSSIHLHNNSLQPQHLLSVIKLLLHVDLFIGEKEFLFASRKSGYNCEHGNFLSSKNSCAFEMQWLYHFKKQSTFIYDLALNKYAVDIAKELTGTNTICNFMISNAYVSDDVATHIMSLIDSNILSGINITNLNLSDQNMITILKALGNSNSLRKLVINSINAVNNCPEELYSVVAGNTDLEYLKISNCNLMESTITKIAEAMSNVQNSLGYLNLSHNSISDTAAMKLASVLRKTISLKHLDLSSTTLQTQGVIGIAQSLKDNACLKTFCINNCTITNEATVDIVSCVLNKLTSLECVELSNCKLEESLMLCITNALSKISTLNSLDLSLNKINGVIASSIATVITNNAGISHLKLSLNSLDEKAAIDIFLSCKILSNLMCVDINFSHFSALLSDDSDYYTIFDFIHNIAISDFVDYTHEIGKRTVKQIRQLTLSNCKCIGMFYTLVLLSSLEYLDVNSSTVPSTAISATISKNTKLKHINFSKCSVQDYRFHEIAEAMSTLVLLKYLNVSGIKMNDTSASFISAVIANNPEIYHLDLSKCQLHHNGLLRIIRQLKCSHLSYLDVSYNYITEEAAKVLFDTFSNGIELIHLCLSHCNLYEQSFLLIAKSLAMMTTLRHLDLSGNTIDIQIAHAISNCTANNHNLEYFDISHCAISENEMQIIVASMKEINFLRHLNISCCEINQFVVDDLVAVINSNRELEHLDISNCHVEEDGMLKILQPLLQMHTLRYVNLESNMISNIFCTEQPENPLNSTAQLVGIISNNALLEYYNLSYCGFPTSQLRHMLKALSELCNLKYFNIANNVKSEEVVVNIASVIKNNRSLEILDISNCGMREDSISIVVDAISQAMCLKSINVSSNMMSYSASLLLASYLEINNVTELDLAHCYLTEDEEEDGLFNVISVLKNCNCFKHLNLGSNKFTEKAARALYNMVCVNQKLEHLNLKQCNISEILLGDIIKQCRALTFLDISYNTVTNEAADILSSAINNGSLEYLNIKDCIMQKEGAKNIFASLTCATQLQYSIAQTDTERAIVGMIINNLNVSILRLYKSPLMEHLSVVKLMYYFKLTSPNNLEKTQDLIISTFSNEVVEYFHASNCVLNFYSILQAIKHNSKLKYLILKSCTIPNKTVSYIVTLMYKNRKLLNVDLSDCNLVGSQILIIAKSLGTVSNLKCFNISSNEITNESVTDIASVIKSNKFLCQLNVSNCGIDDVGAQIICKALSIITSLISLDMSNNYIGNNCAEHIYCVLCSNINLQQLNFTNCFAENLFIISNTPAQLKSIKTLSLENNVIDDNAAEIIKSVFIYDSRIELLNLSHCNMTESGLLSVISALNTVKGLKHLELKSNNFTKAVAGNMLSAIKANHYLKKIDLSHCNLFQTDLIAYVNLLLSSDSAIQYIDFSYNSCDTFIEQEHESSEHNNYINTRMSQQYDRLSNLDAQIYLDIGIYSPVAFTNDGWSNTDAIVYSDVGLHTLTPLRNTDYMPLQYLDLSQCKLSDVLTGKVLLALQQCRSLTYLSLSTCTLTSKTLMRHIIANNQNLEHLDLSDCKLKQRDVITIAVCLRAVKSISYLLLSYNVINDIAAKELAETLSNCLSLKTLSLSDCEIKEKGVLQIVSALQCTRSLQHLDLSYNTISDDAAFNIATVLSRNTSLECLNMSYCTWLNNGVSIICKQLDLEDFTNLQEVYFST